MADPLCYNGNSNDDSTVVSTGEEGGRFYDEIYYDCIARANAVK